MFVILCIFLVRIVYDANCETSTTLNQRERISILRHELKKEIRGAAVDPMHGDTSEEESDYLQLQKLPITPIMGVGKKIQQRTTDPQTTSAIVNTTVQVAKVDRIVKVDANIQEEKRNASLRSQNGTLRSNKRRRPRRPIEIFYRRLYNKDLLESPSETVHCQDMVTPFLTGVKGQMAQPKMLSANDTGVERLLHLLKVDTSSYGREEIYSILFQINNIPLRLFQWDVAPLSMLLNAIIRDRKHNFSNLKLGIRELFKNWRMDISNITNLLKQTRIFRPPCIQISKLDGSTKSPKATKYTKKAERINCDDDGDCKDYYN